MSYIILTLIIGISFSPMLFMNLPFWSAQGMWVQIGIMIAFSWTFIEKPKKLSIKNIPLGLLHLWVGAYTLVFCYISQTKGMYDIKHFFPYFNFLCILILYNIITTYLTRYNIERTLKALRYVIIATLLMCTLQFFNLAQFFKLISNHHAYNNLVTGFLGNGTHLSGFLASAIPLFLWKRTREDWLSLTLLFIVLFLTGTSTGNPSISGFIVGLGVWFYFIKREKISLISTLFILTLMGYIIYPYLPIEFFSVSGRDSIWKLYFNLFHQMPITGMGLGHINVIHKYTTMPQVRFLHMELAHYTVELGWIGLILILNMIKSFFETTAKDKLELVLKSMVLGFLISCCFNYPSHLWLPATTALFAYASIFALRNKEITYAIE